MFWKSKELEANLNSQIIEIEKIVKSLTPCSSKEKNHEMRHLILLFNEVKQCHANALFLSDRHKQKSLSLLDLIGKDFDWLKK